MITNEEQLALFKAVINFSDDAIITKTLGGIITSWNKAAENLFGYTCDEIVGKHISQIIPLELIHEEHLIIEKIKAGEHVKHYETERKRKDGSALFISLTVSPLKNKDGVITGASKIARDITKRKQEEQQLKLLESVITNTTDAVVITEARPLSEPGPRIIYVNDAFTKMTGYSADQVIGKTPRILQGPGSDKDSLEQLSKALHAYLPWETTIINYKKNGEPFWNNFSVNPVLDEKGHCTHFIAIECDVTRRKSKEIQSRLMSELTMMFNDHISLKETLQCVLAQLVKFSSLSGGEFWLIDNDESHISLCATFTGTAENQSFFKREGGIKWLAKGEGLPGMIWDKGMTQFWNNMEDSIFPGTDEAIKAGIKAVYGFPLRHKSEMLGVLVLVQNSKEKPWGIVDNALDNIVAQLGAEIKRKQVDMARKEAEAASIKALEERNTILESIDDAFFAVNRDWIVTYWNKRAEGVLLKRRDEMLGHNLWVVFPEAVASVSHQQYHLAIETGIAAHFEDYYYPLQKWYEVNAYPSDSGLSVYFKDISERRDTETKLKELNEGLAKQTKELTTSNAELEQFAYVASHDLQEPLRMVTSFLTQLEKKYGDVIDDKGKKYIYFAVDGAKRMRQIILDLLEFSRVGRTEDKMEPVDLCKLVNDILVLYRKQIDDCNAAISYGDLPLVLTNRSPMRQIFQNLISNALKYAKKGVNPSVKISCEDAGQYWQFSVSDNGIGIEAQYFDKIFIIFQRLHNKDEYSGTGMGLAITRKIIEHMGGNIWVESEEGKGSTFYFTISKNNS